MAVQLSVPLAYPGLANYFQDSHREHPDFKVGATLRDVGNRIDKHFLLAAEIVEKLRNDGWQIRLYCHAALAQHADLKTQEKADLRVKAIGIDPKYVTVYSTWDDWFPPGRELSGQEIMEALGFPPEG